MIESKLNLFYVTSIRLSHPLNKPDQREKTEEWLILLLHYDYYFMLAFVVGCVHYKMNYDNCCLDSLSLLYDPKSSEKDLGAAKLPQYPQRI